MKELRIELKKSNVSRADKFMNTAYPSSGFYENTDDSGMIEIIFVTKYSVWILQSDELNEFIYNDSWEAVTKPIQVEGSVSESFALKMLAITQGNVKDVDLG